MFPFFTDESSQDGNMTKDDSTVKLDLPTPQLVCMGKVHLSENVFSLHGFTCRGELDAILNDHDPNATLFTEEEVYLFNRCFIFDEAFFNDIGLLTTLAKTAYERVEFLARGSQVHQAGNHPRVLKQQIAEFLAYVKVYTHRFLLDFGKAEEMEAFYDRLAEVLRQAFTLLTPMANMPSIVFSGGSLHNDSPVAVLFHTHFDVHWSIIEVAYMAVNLRKYHESSRKTREKFASIFLSLAEALCADLVYLALRRFPDIHPKDWSGSSPFNCTCVRELWYMLLTVLAKAEDASPYNFVLKRFQCLQDAPSSSFYQTFDETKKLQMPCKDPLAMLWLFAHLARQSGFNLTGVWDGNFSRMDANYDVINKLVQSYLTASDSAAVAEDRTKGMVGCLYSLSHVWGSNLNLCIVLWEHFSKKLDQHFTTPSPFEPVPYSSSTSWFEHLTVNVEPWKSISSHHNSYFMFLRLLGYHMEQMSPKNQASLKARLYLKLQGRKVMDLSPVGLYHVMSACLTVALTSDSSEMCVKILEMMENHRQSLLFFASEMVLLLISVSKGRECHDIAESIANKLERASLCFGDADGHVREEQRKYGAIFVEGFQEVVLQSRNFSIGQMKLIDKPLRHYIKNCGNCDRTTLIEALTCLLRKLRNSSSHCEEVCNALMSNIFPVMKEKFAAVDHAPFFVELTVASLETGRPEFQSLFNYFCLDEKINPRLSARYLGHLLENKQFTVSLSLLLDNYQTILIQSWFRIAFLLPSTGDFKEDMDRIGGFIRRLPRMVELVALSNIPSKGTELIVDFLLVMSNSHQNIQNLNERATAKDAYLQLIGPLDKSLSASSGISSTWEPADQVNHVMRMGGHLFFHCGNICYTKGKVDCLIAQLNNILLAPAGVADLGKDLPNSLSSALQQYLPLYIFGLFRLNPVREPHIMRCLGSIFQNYMTRFTPNHTHPFTRCWIGLESEPVTLALVPHVRTWFLQTISNSVLPQKTARNSPYLQPTMQWLKYLATNKEWKLEIVRSTLLPALELALILDEISCRRSVSDFLQSSVSSSEEEQMVIAEKALCDLITRHLAFNSSRVFKLVETISIINSDLVRRALPTIKNHVAITEAKRGTGADSVLRQQLKALELTLCASSND